MASLSATGKAALEARSAPPIIQVLACGNTLRGDDGVAWQIAALLEARPPCRGIHVTFSTQLLPEHAALLSAADRILFIDCSAVTAPGTVCVTAVGPAATPSTSFTHHLDPSGVLRLAQDLYGRAPCRAVIVTVGGGCFEMKEELSARVADAIPAALEAVQAYAVIETWPLL